MKSIGGLVLDMGRVCEQRGYERGVCRRQLCMLVIQVLTETLADWQMLKPTTIDRAIYSKRNPELR